jgi:hypothetical protein
VNGALVQALLDKLIHTRRLSSMGAGRLHTIINQVTGIFRPSYGPWNGRPKGNLWGCDDEGGEGEEHLDVEQ